MQLMYFWDFLGFLSENYLRSPGEEQKHKKALL